MGGRLDGQSSRLHSSFVQQRRELNGGKTKNGVDRYISEAAEDVIEGATYDVLKWRANNEYKLPVLALIAHDVFAVPVTTVSSEVAFSIGGRIIDPFRSSLSPKTVEALICLKNWLSEIHQPIIVKNYIDESEVFETSENLEIEISTTPTPNTSSNIGNQDALLFV
ncbi:Ribonuclease H-like domain containing protein [Trema orientale]|uniref:Ribonuclease H-like domain containing protein n=1 Tax=Trema orientale TaxID=63057 RepID=A0A2P5CWN3_TREOI|nr:Ribonuclease H-like domain containing protein [Trema orientale]